MNGRTSLEPEAGMGRYPDASFEMPSTGDECPSCVEELAHKLEFYTMRYARRHCWLTRCKCPCHKGRSS